MRRALFHPVVRRDAWRDQIDEVFRSFQIEPEGTADHVAAGMAVYCRTHHPQGVQRSDLVLLTARAFCAVNDRATAERVLRSMQPHARHVERWMEILFELDRFPDLLPYFSLGIIRPADWAGAQLDRMWILDFGRLMLSDAERHEIMLHRTVQLIVQAMVPFWDSVSGDGVLGVKGLNALQADIAGGRRNMPVPREDLMCYIEDLLAQARTQRDWQTVPRLLNLDL